MKKCILLVRVSTQRQEMDEQERELYDLALRDGYTEDNIIPICEKESAIKLSEEERNGLIRMKEEIAKGGVKCVYAWEISRLARRQKVLHSVIDYLADRKIQLIIKTPYIKYLNDDGTRNEGSEMMVAMLALGAETEIRKLKERERRTKAANALKGIWNGGPTVKYGYSIDSANRYVVNETEGQVVRLLFDLYANSRMGQRQLRKEMESRGYILSEDRIRKILSDVGYTGEPYTTKIWSKTEGKYLPGRTVQYPAIVSKEAFLAAQEKREVANTNVYRGTKYFFASGLIQCKECGHAYCGYDHDNLYMCLAHRHANHDIPQCGNNVTINLTALDSLLWYEASAKHFRWLYENSETQKENLLKELEIIEQKIAKEQQTIDSVEERLSDIAEMVIDRMMTKEKGKIKAAKVREEAQSAEDKIAAYRQRQTAINTLLDNSSKDIDNAALIEALDGILGVDQLKQMSDIVHKYVEYVTVDRYEYDEKHTGKQCGPYRVVNIHFYDGEEHSYLVYARGEKYEYSAYTFETPEAVDVKIIQRGAKRGNNRLSKKQRERRRMELLPESNNQ